MLIRKLGRNSDKLILRIPVIPGFTDAAMVRKTQENLKKIGVSRFNLFTYHTERPNKVSSLIDGLEVGKAKCELLKAIRNDLAGRYGVDMPERVCTHEGDCPGTCPLCEADLESLTRQIKALTPENLSVSDEIMDRCQLKNSFAPPPVAESESKHKRIEKPHLSGLVMPPAPPRDYEIAEPPLPGIPDISRPLTGQISSPPLPPEPEPTEMEYKKVFFKECAVAGLSFHIERDDELWDELHEGAKIALVRQRDNKYDHNAVAVALADDYGGDPDDFDLDFILGYIPRTHNAEIAAMMDAGYADKFEAEITTYRRYGSYNERIRITIWLLSSQPVKVRPDRWRILDMNYVECRMMAEELQRRGTAHFTWGFSLDKSKDLPIVGEDIVFLRKESGRGFLFLMKVLATGDDCAAYLDDPEEISNKSGLATFVLTNVMGPVIVNLNELAFLDLSTLHHRRADEWPSADEDKALKELFDKKLDEWFPKIGNIDQDPTIDDPEILDFL